MCSRETETATGQTDLTGQTVTAEVPLIGTSPDRPDGQDRTGPTPPDTWRSWRFTVSYRQRIRELFDGTCPYLAAFETSKKGEEHFHVISIGPDRHDTIRKRMARSEFWKGKKWWSHKDYKTFLGGLSYTTKCGDYWKSDDFPDYEYQPWVWKTTSQPTIATDERASKRARVEERDWQLTYSNLVFQAVKYHRANGMNADESLKSVVKHMIAHTKWRPCNQMYKCGIVEHYELDFQFRTGQTKAPDMSWWAPKNL